MAQNINRLNSTNITCRICPHTYLERTLGCFKCKKKMDFQMTTLNHVCEIILKSVLSWTLLSLLVVRFHFHLLVFISFPKLPDPSFIFMWFLQSCSMTSLWCDFESYLLSWGSAHGPRWTFRRASWSPLGHSEFPRDVKTTDSTIYSEPWRPFPT